MTAFTVLQGVCSSLLRLHTLRLENAAKSAIADFRYNIFPVGDDSAITHSLGLILSREGYHVDVSDSASYALELMEKG